MTASNFAASLAAVLKSEGGNDDDPSDHGGRTSRGITQREYDKWLSNEGRPHLDVWKAPQADIDAIYHSDYWEPHCDDLPVGADYLLFNMNVNAGPGRGAKILQQALGVDADGDIGPLTEKAIAAADPVQLIEKYSGASRAFYLGLNQPKFTKGWLNRVEFVRATALGMIAKTPKTIPPILVPPPGAVLVKPLAPTFWGRIADLFKAKGN